VAALNCQDARIAKLDADLNQREAILSNRLALAGNAVTTGQPEMQPAGNQGLIAKRSRNNVNQRKNLQSWK
jgi:hypothetical protein